MNFTVWKIYKNGALVHETPAVSTDGGMTYYFEAPSSAGFTVGDEIAIAVPVGAPVYTCDVTAVNAIEGKSDYAQVLAKSKGVSMAGIKP